MRRLITLACALLLIGATVTPARAADPFDINVVLSLTGAGAFLGVSEQKAIGAIEALTNKSGGIKGRPVHSSLPTISRIRKLRSNS